MRAGSGSEAVAVPARTVVIRVRRAVVNDRCRAAIGCPVRGPLRKGAAMAAALRVAAWTSSVADDPGGVLLADQLRVV